MDKNKKFIDYINEIYGKQYQNNGIFNNIDKSLIEKWRYNDKETVKCLYETKKNIEKYLEISNRKELAIKCGAFLIDDGYTEENDKIWKGKGKRAITINQYKNLDEEEQKKTVPVCPGDELQYFGAFGIHWATHNGIYMGTDNPDEYGKIIEVDSHIQPTLYNRIHSLTLMIALGYICGSINCYRNLDQFTNHYIGNEPTFSGPRRPTNIIENKNVYSRKEILERSIKCLEIKIWEYNIQTANCETFTRFVVTGEWIEESFFYVRILENLFESYIKNYTNSDEISEIYKLLIVIFNKAHNINIKKIIFKILKNINKTLVEKGEVELSHFIKSLMDVGLDLITNIDKIEEHKDIDIIFDNPNGIISIDDTQNDIQIKNAKIIKKNENSYQELIKNQKIIMDELQKINNNLIKNQKNKTQFLQIINKLIDKIN